MLSVFAEGGGLYVRQANDMKQQHAELQKVSISSAPNGVWAGMPNIIVWRVWTLKRTEIFYLNILQDLFIS